MSKNTLKKEYKSLDFTLTDIEEVSANEWIIEGYASTWTKDNGNDRIELGAFLKTIEARFTGPKKRGKSKVKVLWQHETDEIIGQLLEAKEDAKGLFVRIRLIQDEVFPLARKAYILAKLGELDSFSIGYSVVSYRIEEEDGVKVRVITELKWYEVSIVTFPMNEQAEFTQVKNEEEEFLMNEQIVKLLEDMNTKFDALLEAHNKGTEISAKYLEEYIKDRELVNVDVTINGQEIKTDTKLAEEVAANGPYNVEALKEAAEVLAVAGGQELEKEVKSDDIVLSELSILRAEINAIKDLVQKLVECEEEDDMAEMAMDPNVQACDQEELMVKEEKEEKEDSTPVETEEDFFSVFLNSEFKFN